MSTLQLNLNRQGSGRPVVLIHGVGHHWQAFTPIIGRLSGAGFEVTAIDLPGFGGSPPLAGDDLSIPAYTRAIAAWLTERGERPAVVGNSMGGAIALELARRGLVSSAVAISPAGFWTPAERRYCQLALGLAAGLPAPLQPAVQRALATRVGRTALMGHLFGRPWRLPAAEAQATLLDSWRAPAMEGALAAFSRYRFPDPEPLPQPPAVAPMTVLWGSRDLLLPFALQAPRARRELPQARHVTLPGLGHVPFWDDPGMVARVILGVLDAQTSSTAGTAPTLAPR